MANRDFNDPVAQNFQDRIGALSNPNLTKAQRDELERATTRPPPTSLNEAVFDSPPGYEQDEHVMAAHAALKAGRVAAEQAREMADAQLANMMLTEPARHRAARDGVFRMTKNALAKLQRTSEQLGAKITALEAICSGPPLPKNVADVFTVSQIQTTLLGMDAERRRKVLREAITADKPSLVECAVLRGPAFLVGLSQPEQDQFRLEWGHRRAPEHVARLEIYRKVEEHVDRGGKLLLDYANSLSNAQLIETAEIREKRAKGLIDSLGAE